MSLQQVMATNSITASPIGRIPEAYPHLSQLCRAAHIRYSDERIKDSDLSLRTWKAVYDKAGLRQCLEFHKFCMLLDLIDHEHPKWNRQEKLDAAIGLQPGAKLELLKLGWIEMNDKLAAMGVNGYQTILRKKPKSEGRFEQFSDVLA